MGKINFFFSVCKLFRALLLYFTFILGKHLVKNSQRNSNENRN